MQARKRVHKYGGILFESERPSMGYADCKITEESLSTCTEYSNNDNIINYNVNNNNNNNNVSLNYSINNYNNNITSTNNGNTGSTANPVPGPIHCFYTNADSLLNKLPELKIRIIELNYPEIICITEVKPKNSRFTIDEVEISLPGYNLYILENFNTQGRGVVIYTHSSISATSYSIDTSTFEEVVCINIKLLNSATLLLACVYRSPNSSTINNHNLLDFINNICKINPVYYIFIGDFNIPGIDWNSWSCNGEDSFNNYKSAFLNCLRDNFLYQHVDKTTRGRLGQTSNILDLIISNNNEIVNNICYSSPLGKSDHCVLHFSINCHKIFNTSKTTKLNYDKGNYITMVKNLDINWDDIINVTNSSIEDDWKSFMSIINKNIDTYIPKKKLGNSFKPKHKTPLDSKSLKLIRKKHRTLATLQGMQHYRKVQHIL